MDLTEHIASKSDQMDYQDFLAGPRTVTVREVRKGPSAEQPVEVLADGLDRPWRPAKSMRRVLVAAWGADSSAYIGRSLELFGDPSVKWAGAPVGGIRVSAMSHIEKPMTVSLTTTRGKREPFTVKPLAAPAHPVKAAVDWDAELQAAGTDMSAIKAIYNRANKLGDTAALAKIKAAGDAILAANKEES